MAKVEYTELSSANVKDNRSIVISECSKGGFTLAQKVCINEGGSKIGLYLKNAIHIDDISGLYNLRDALNLAISKIDKNP